MTVKSKATIILLKEAQRNFKRWDYYKWAGAMIVLTAALILDHYYSGVVSDWMRLLGWLIVVAISGLIAKYTQGGGKLIGFVFETQMELRKVTWPKRPEVMQITIVIAIVVCALALMLWGMDGILVTLLSGLTK